MPAMHIIAGPDGAGKTTASNTLLPEFFRVNQFVNADEIAKGLSPFAPETVFVESAGIMLGRNNTLVKGGESFGFETTLTTLAYKNYIKRAKESGYTVKLLFLWLNSPELADNWLIFDNSSGEYTIVAKYEENIQEIFNLAVWEKLKL
jgi:predicted ABC-type ATPase